MLHPLIIFVIQRLCEKEPRFNGVLFKKEFTLI